MLKIGGQSIRFGTEIPELKSCVALGKAHHYFLANLWSRRAKGTHVDLAQSPSAPSMEPGVLLCCVLTCACVVVRLSLKGKMEDEVTY